MRLLHTMTKEIEEFLGDTIPSYAILSHTWGDNEATFQDYRQGRGLAGFAKIDGFCEQARKDGYDYVWIDTCCIDKSSSAELSEAINSMFAWYRKARICYAYLEDVFSTSTSSISNSRWFRRGWTLQELLAPREVVFFDREWRKIEVLTKSWRSPETEFVETLARVTRIPTRYLHSLDVSKASVAQKLSWAAGRKTTREEDLAYCLLGIFDINMTLLYGEGKKAFVRLQEEILRTSDDHTLFAWGFDPWLPWDVESVSEWDSTGNLSRTMCNGAGILARSPDAFLKCGDVVRFQPPGQKGSHFSMTNRGLYINLRYRSFPHSPFNAILVALNCSTATSQPRYQIMALPLCFADQEDDRCFRSPSSVPVLVPADLFGSETSRMYIDRGLEGSHLLSCTLTLESPLLVRDSGFYLAEVYPPFISCWPVKSQWSDAILTTSVRFMIVMPNNVWMPGTQHMILQFRHTSGRSFLLWIVLHYKIDRSATVARPTRAMHYFIGLMDVKGQSLAQFIFEHHHDMKDAVHWRQKLSSEDFGPGILTTRLEDATPKVDPAAESKDEPRKLFLDFQVPAHSKI